MLLTYNRMRGSYTILNELNKQGGLILGFFQEYKKEN